MPIYYHYGAVIIARRRYPELYQNRGKDIWCIPGGKTGMWIVAVWGVIANSIAIYYVFAFPWISEGISVTGWRVSLAVIMVIIAVVGVLLYRHSLKQQRNT